MKNPRRREQILTKISRAKVADTLQNTTTVSLFELSNQAFSELESSVNPFFYDNYRNSHALIGLFIVNHCQYADRHMNLKYSCDASSASESGQFDNLLSGKKQIDVRF